MIISNEQRAVAQNLVDSDVVVDAVAGSGKTTTVLHIAASITSSILLLTYNARLRQETQQRANHLQNLEIHTYHSFGYKYVSKKCSTDAGFMDPEAQKVVLPAYDVVIVDECQDMTALYCALVKRIACRRLCLLGDKNQSIYAFAGADERFITLSDKVFGRQFVKLPLCTSYRVTRPIAAFVNYLLKQQRLHAVKDGPMPVYHIASAFNPLPIYKVVVKLIQDHGIDNVFVLAPSVKSRSEHNPVNKLANMLSENGIKIFVPSDDDSKLNDDVCAAKLVFCSFHQSKGLERAAVVVLGFDASYFAYYSKEDPSRCNNALYVALTRATCELHVFHADKQQPLAFARKGILQYVTVRGNVKKITPNHAVAKSIAVTKLTAQLPSKLLAASMQVLRCTNLRPASQLIDLPCVVAQHDDEADWCENVSDINGVAIPAYYQFKQLGLSHICDNVRDLNDIPTLLETANSYLAKREDLIFKTIQIKQYTWLTQDMLDQSYSRLLAELCIDEIQMEVKLEFALGGRTIHGVADVISHRILEIKAVSELQPEHFIQVAVYGYASRCNGNNLPCYLYNLRTDELWQVDFDTKDMEFVVRSLVEHRSGMVVKTTDEEFLKSLE